MMNKNYLSYLLSTAYRYIFKENNLKSKELTRKAWGSTLDVSIWCLKTSDSDVGLRTEKIEIFLMAVNP